MVNQYLLTNRFLLLLPALLFLFGSCQKTSTVPTLEWSEKSTASYPGSPISFKGLARDEQQVLYFEAVLEDAEGYTIQNLYRKYIFSQEISIQFLVSLNPGVVPFGDYFIRMRLIGEEGEFVERIPHSFQQHPDTDKKLVAYLTHDNNSDVNVKAYNLEGTVVYTHQLNGSHQSSGFLHQRIFVCYDYFQPKLAMVNMKTREVRDIWTSTNSNHRPVIFETPDRIYLIEKETDIYGFDATGSKVFDRHLSGISAIDRLYQIGNRLFVSYLVGAERWIAVFDAGTSSLIRNTRLYNVAHYFFGAGNPEQFNYLYLNEHYAYSYSTNKIELKGSASWYTNVVGEGASQYKDQVAYLGTRHNGILRYTDADGTYPWYQPDQSKYRDLRALKVDPVSGFAIAHYFIPDEILTLDINEKSIYFSRPLAETVIAAYPADLE